MNIILKYILTNVKERKARTAVMLLSILLSTTLLFVSFSIGASYESAQRKMARGMAGSATISISATGGAGGVRASTIPQLAGIGASCGMLQESALYHENGYYETVDLVAADLSQLGQINKPRLLDGTEITGFTGNKIILPDRFTSKYGIEKGDTVTLQVNGTPVCFEVAQIAAYDTVFLRQTRGATALVPLSTMAQLMGQPADQYSEILVKPAENVSTDELISKLKTALPDSGYRVAKTVNEKQIAADARQKSMPFFLISFFSLTMSVFIIYSSYKVITLDRLPVIGTFRSIGATQKMVTQILLWESLLYGALGGLLGIPAGVVALKLILQGLGQSLSQGIEIPVVISPLSSIASLLMAVSVSLFSAWAPVRRASRLPIKAVVLGTVEEKRTPRRVIVLAGAGLLAVSLLLPRIASGKVLYFAGGFSLLGLIAATILIIPAVTDLACAGLEVLYGHLFQNEGRLAARNMKGNKSVAQNVTLLFISISAVIAISVVGNFVTSYISDVFSGAELQGFADAQMQPEFVEQVKGMDGIEKVLPLLVFDSELQGDGVTFSRLEATDNLDWYSSMFALHYTQDGMQAGAAAAFAQGRAMVVSADWLKQRGLSVGDTVAVSNGTTTGLYAIAGSFKSRATDVQAVIPTGDAVADFGTRPYGLLAYTAADPDAIMVQLRALFGDTANWSRTVAEFNADALSTVGAFLQPMHSMTYFILLLATVGIINNLLINYMQKRRTIAMYRSFGLSNRQNIKMTLIEGLSSGLLGAVIAMGVSYLEIQTIFLVAGPKIAMAPQLSASTFLLAGAMGVVITLLGSAVPIFKSRKMRLVQELKFD